MALRYIAIEGPIGVGKTTLAQKLALEFGSSLLLERPEDNPFLPRFYRDPTAALPTQLTFLLQRAGQIEWLHQPDLFAQSWVADFMFDKDALFAELTLTHADYPLYRSVFERLIQDLPQPDCVIYLTAPVETLLARIVSRGRDYESAIAPEYLIQLAQAYGRYFSQYAAAPVIEADTMALDFVGNDEHYRQLLQALQAPTGYKRLPAVTLL